MRETSLTLNYEIAGMDGWMDGWHPWLQDIGTWCTVLVIRMAQRKWKDSKQQPGTAGPGNMLGCCLIYFHFLWAILSTSTVVYKLFW